MKRYGNVSGSFEIRVDSRHAHGFLTMLLGRVPAADESVRVYSDERSVIRDFGTPEDLAAFDAKVARRERRRARIRRKKRRGWA